MPRFSPFALAGAIVATSLTLLSAAPAGAASARVGYADLDLGTSAGRAALETRVHRAAGRVCRAENRELSYATACQRESVERAAADIGRLLADNHMQMASR